MKLYKNGDRCPCCGQVIEGKSPEWLELFRLTAVLRIGDRSIYPTDEEVRSDATDKTH